jgi:hypothetical protein
LSLLFEGGNSKRFGTDSSQDESEEDGEMIDENKPEDIDQYDPMIRDSIIKLENWTGWMY